MARTEIAQVFRAVIFATAPINYTKYKSFGENSDAAWKRMSALDDKVGVLAKTHDVEFESLNTQLLSDGAFALESSDRDKLVKAVEDIEALIVGTKGVNLEAAD
ncbi:hypothetical protein G3A43_07800 [Paraburkholderia aspalathi]|nr:hypothetical protein [Paraburkholderia aspalathi]MBK3780159.1 hypothetical protein [Paraburkholderia aspalathi]